MALDALSVFVAFMLFESCFCFTAALISASNKSFEKIVVPMTALNALAGVMLLSEFLTYVYAGRTEPVYVTLEIVTHFAVFACLDLLLFAYVIYLALVIFGRIDLKPDMPCRKRFIISLGIALAGVLLVIISQFTGMYYTIDNSGIYHRGPLFWLSAVIPAFGALLVTSILIPYRKQLGVHKFAVFITYLVLPCLGFLAHFIHPGYSFLEISIGFAILLMFAESGIERNREIVRVGMTEVRTGLANEHGCIEWYNSNLIGKDRLKYAVVFFDLKQFSEVNRIHGMELGTTILLNYARDLRSILEDDEILGRQYGNQFVAIIKKESLHGFLKQIEKHKVTFEQDGQKCTVSIGARAGVYEILREDLDGQEVIAYAGTALSMAKTSSAPDIVMMTQSLMDSLEKTKQQYDAIRKGFKNNEFLAYYQPKVRISDNKLCGAEALARWDRDGSIRQPSEFLPTMEIDHSVSELDLIILEQVCQDLKRWIDAGLEPPVISVNYCRIHLSPIMARIINDMVNKYDIPHDLIEVEITERSDKPNLETLKEFVDLLHSYGFRASIDDFGVESSSLTLLREISFDTLKIDKGFVDKEDKRDLAILEHIVRMAHSIDVDIVAEGVERDSQIETLKSLGVDVIQGFYFSGPVSSDKMTELVTEGRIEHAAQDEN